VELRAGPPKGPEFAVFAPYSCQSHHRKDTQEIGVNDRTTHGFELDGLNNLLPVGLEKENDNELGKQIKMYNYPIIQSSLEEHTISKAIITV
jgi:hypothetical protein